ncbi:MAG: hypothetical protein LBV67_03850 [Streptococcaceae bacterium]|jgi:hypothetical protein|nr:hypothetical protein [Streptococcaceae bacterium]
MKRLSLIINKNQETLVIQGKDEKVRFPCVEKMNDTKELLNIEVDLGETYLITEKQEYFLATIKTGDVKYSQEGRVFWLPVDLYSDVQWNEYDEQIRQLLQKQGLDRSF